jgi:hypothetical protein
MARSRVLVRAILTSQAMYNITSVDIPKEVLKKINTILRAYL